MNSINVWGEETDLSYRRILFNMSHLQKVELDFFECELDIVTCIQRREYGEGSDSNFPTDKWPTALEPHKED